MNEVEEVEDPKPMAADLLREGISEFRLLARRKKGHLILSWSSTTDKILFDSISQLYIWNFGQWLKPKS